jgi:hypothetical protein
MGGDIDAAVDAAANPDADDTQPDASAGPTRAGTIAILDLAHTNPGFEAVTGAAVNISYSDLTVADAEPAYDDRTGPFLTGCAVWTYSGGATPQPQVHEGDVTISDTLSPIGTCSWDEPSMSYGCSTGNGTLANAAAAAAGGSLTIQVFNNEFDTFDLLGARLAVSGFANAENNGTFQVIGQQATTVTLRNPAAVSEPAATGIDFTAITGGGPTAAGRDFLGDDTNMIMINKSAGPVVPAIADAIIIPSGDGLVLDSNSTLPHEMPLIPAGEAVFSCNPGAGGNCGVGGGTIYGTVISGSTTDADLAGTSPIDMPDPVDSWARFQCRILSNADMVITQAAIETIMSTNPTRVETQMFRITADVGHTDTSIIAGHGLIGYTDVPAP